MGCGASTSKCQRAQSLAADPSPKSTNTSLPGTPLHNQKTDESLGKASPPARSKPGAPGSGITSLPASPAASDTSAVAALQLRRLSTGPLMCLVLKSSQSQSQSGASSNGGRGDMPMECGVYIGQLTRGDHDQQLRAAAYLREQLCSPSGNISSGLVEAGAVAPLALILQDGPAEAKLDAAWALTNIAAGGYIDAEAVVNESGGDLLADLVQRSVPEQLAAGTSGAASSGLLEVALWGIANIAGAIHPALKVQNLAQQMLDAGVLKPLLELLGALADGVERAAKAGGSGVAPATPLLRVAAWCLHNLAKYKREKEMVDAIPVVTKLLLSCDDVEVLTCCAWVMAYLGSNEENKSHIKQALPTLPRLVLWVREASSSLATPSLLSLGTMCTGYMRVLDYSGDVVEAGGVPAMLAYLKRGASSGGDSSSSNGVAARPGSGSQKGSLMRRSMVKEALFALSNVAGGNNATVKAMLDAGAFGDVLALLRSAGSDEEIRMECLYVLTNPWDPLVGAEVTTSAGLVASGILQELHGLLEPGAPVERLRLLLKGLGDGLKRGQQLMTHAATMALVEHGPEGAAKLPPPANPVVALYVSLGTVGRIEALNGHSDEEVGTRANGILTVLKFFT